MTLRNELFEQWQSQQIQLSGIRLAAGNALIVPETSTSSASNSPPQTIVPSTSQKVFPSPPLPQSFGLGWYAQQLLQDWHLTLQMVVSSALIELFAIGMPIFYMVIFDRVFGRQNLSTLNVMAIGMLLVVSADVLVKHLRSYVLSHQLESIDKSTLSLLLRQVLGAPLSVLSRGTMQGVSERFPELFRMNQVIVTTLLTSSLDAVFSVFVVALLFILNPQMATLSLLPIVPMAILTLWSSPLVRKRGALFAAEQRKSQIQFSELVQHAETIHSVHAAEQLESRVMTGAVEGFTQGFSSRFDRVNGTQMQSFFTNLGSVVTLYFGALIVLEGKISFGAYMAINMLSRVVLGTLQRLLQQLSQYQEVRDTMQFCKELFSKTELNAEPEQGIQLPNVRGDITVENVSFQYEPQQRQILQGLSLEIHAGEKIILTGQSGAGKTTLIRLLQRLYTPEPGTMLLDGMHLSHLDVASLRQHVGVALQKPAIFAGTFRENLLLGNPNVSTQELLEVMSLVELDELLAQMPKGLDTKLAPMGSNLSGGQVAKVALARTLLKKPTVLILDEALAALSFVSADALYTRLLERYANQTCIFVTDHIPLHHQANRILVLHEGKVVEDGTASQLIQAKSYYYHLHHALPNPERLAGVG